MSDGFVLRAAEDADLNFIRKSWMREGAASHWARTVGLAQYWKEHVAVRDRLMAAGALLIAGRESIPGSICGFACTQGDRVHFVAVKERWRRQGVARLLLGGLLDRPMVCSHRTDVCAELPIPKHWTFNLYAAFGAP